MEIRFMALFLSAFFSLTMLTGCTKDDIEKVDISEMTPEEIFELYEAELNDLAAWAIGYGDELQIHIHEDKLEIKTRSEENVHLVDVASDNEIDTAKIMQFMKMLDSYSVMSNYYKENDFDTPFCITTRVSSVYGESFFYYPEGLILDQDTVERIHKEIIDLGDGWYYMRLYEMPD